MATTYTREDIELSYYKNNQPVIGE